jgi:hypothetical protein
MRDPPDNIEEYKSLYGSLGAYLQMGVVRSRQQSGSKAPAAGGAPGPPAAGPALGVRPAMVGGPSQVFVVSNQPMGRAGVPMVPQGMVSAERSLHLHRPHTALQVNLAQARPAAAPGQPSPGGVRHVFQGQQNNFQ